MTKFIIIIQARNGSLRLPRKMVKPFFEGKTILQVLIERLQKELDYPVWLATTTSQVDDELVETVKDYGIHIFRGDENNVYSRFASILKKEPTKYCVRICGDNPFLHMGYLQQLINHSEGYDYTSFYDGEVPVIKTHYGIFAEIIRSQSFLEFDKKKMTQVIKEHVTPFLYHNEDHYRTNKVSLPEELKECKHLRLTVDTEKDFKLAKELYTKHNREGGIEYDLSSLLRDVRTNQEIQEKMNQQIQKNSK